MYSKFLRRHLQLVIHKQWTLFYNYHLRIPEILSQFTFINLVNLLFRYGIKVIPFSWLSYKDYMQFTKTVKEVLIFVPLPVPLSEPPKSINYNLEIWTLYIELLSLISKVIVRISCDYGATGEFLSRF